MDTEKAIFLPAVAKMKALRNLQKANTANPTPANLTAQAQSEQLFDEFLQTVTIMYANSEKWQEANKDAQIKTLKQTELKF